MEDELPTMVEGPTPEDDKDIWGFVVQSLTMALVAIAVVNLIITRIVVARADAEIRSIRAGIRSIRQGPTRHQRGLPHDGVNGQLFLAVMWEDLDSVKEALQIGANVEATDIDGRTPLYWACFRGHLAVVQELVARGANLVATDNDGNTPLHMACEDGNRDIVQYLLTSSRRENLLEAADNNGATPLHKACLLGHLDVVQELVARGAGLFLVASHGQTAFDYAIFGGHNNIVDYLLHAYANKVSAREDSQAIHSILQTATFLEVENFHPPLALPPQVHLPLGNLTVDHFHSLLQSFPANLTSSQDNNGQLPLHIACRVGAPIEMLRLFVQAYAAALQTADNNGGLPLHAACQADSPSLDAIRFVAEQDPNAVQAANNDGALPLHLLCASRPSVQVVKYLVQFFEGALAMSTHQGDLPLMVACKASSSPSVVQVLLRAYPEALVYMKEFYSGR